MQKAESRKANVQSQPATKQGGGMAVESPQGEQIAQLEAMMDSSPQSQRLGNMAAMMNGAPAPNSARAAQLRMMNMVANARQPALQRMADMIHNSPRQQAAQKKADNINNSPMMVAQRKKIESLFGVAQRDEDKEPLQGKFAAETSAQLKEDPAPKPNNTGLPDNLKSGIENLSGMSMDNVKVHYNSSQPAQLNALAYAQGTDIHVAPGQEQYLPHEAWHVVQQAQGRVKPTMQMMSGNKQGLPLRPPKLSESLVQRVVYKGEDYQKKKPDFVNVAVTDLGTTKSDAPDKVLDSLDQLKEHDATTVIKGAEHLRTLIRLDTSPPEDAFQDEFARVRENCTAMATPASSLVSFAGGEKTTPQYHLGVLNQHTDALDKIPVQHNEFSKLKGGLGALGNSLVHAKKNLLGADNIIKSITQTGNAALTWVKEFPALFFNSMRKWRIKGSIGAVDEEGSYLTIGPKSDTLGPGWAAQDKRGAVIRAEPWSPGINDAWLKSGIRTELPFKLSQRPPEPILEALRTGSQEQLKRASIEHAEENMDTPKDSHYWDTRLGDSGGYTRLGVELSELLRSGYRLSEGF